LLSNVIYIRVDYTAAERNGQQPMQAKTNLPHGPWARNSTSTNPLDGTNQPDEFGIKIRSIVSSSANPTNKTSSHIGQLIKPYSGVQTGFQNAFPSLEKLFISFRLSTITS
jgi:hypothetical protein